MARITTTERKYSLDHIFNMGFDEDLQVPAFELLNYDPLATDADGNVIGGLKRVTTNAMGEYYVNDIDEPGAIQYLGKEDASGDWFIQKIDNTLGTSSSLRYASKKNNNSINNYVEAWDSHTTLTYGTYSQAF